MSEKPRRTSNASGDNRPMYKGNRTENHAVKKVATKVKGLKTTAGMVTDTIVMEPPPRR